MNTFISTLFGIDQQINLTNNGSSFIDITWLDDKLMEYSRANFVKLFNLHPSTRGRVGMLVNDSNDKLVRGSVNTSRWYKSYLYKPKIEECMKSYMYSAHDETDEDLTLPDEFKPYLDFMNRNLETPYNQMIVNWYENGFDKIAPHSDCTKHMPENAPIGIICLNEKSSRKFRFTAKGDTTDAIAHHIDINLETGCIITMRGKTNIEFKHAVPVDKTINTGRISITFRQLIEN